MSSTSYTLAASTGLIRHFPAAVPTVHDGSSPASSQLDAAARSGDYFMTLAIMLESISLQLNYEDKGSAQALDSLVQDLEYLQRTYTIVRKPKNYKRHDQ